MKTDDKKLSLELISKDEIEQCTSSSNIVIRFVPHQSNPLQDIGSKPALDFPNTKFENLPCICNKNYQKESAFSWYKFLLNKFKENPTCTLWVNPSLMPISCFLSCVDAWKEFSKTVVDTTILGIYIPTASKCSESEDNMTIWRPNMRDILEEKTDIKNAIWYPCLARSEEELQSSASNLNIFEIFPITEVSSEAGIGPYFGMTRHKNFLDENKVRTEKIMYINRKTPNETFEYLVNSIEHLPRRPTIATPIVTPGGDPINYIAIALAAVATDTALLLRMKESFLETLTDDCFILKSEV